MLRFRYIAYDNYGKKQRGFIEADSRDVAVNLIKRKGLQPTGVFGPYGKDAGARKFSISRVRVKALSAYTRKFAQLYKAGIAIDEIFELLGEEEDSGLLRRTSVQLKTDVREGLELKEALNKYPAVFPPLFVALFNAGIQSGNLEDVADRLADLYEKESVLRIQMMSKLAYPMAMLGFTLLVTFGMAYFGFMSSDLARSLIIFWGGFFALVIFFCTPIGYPILREILRRTPYIGQVMLKTNMSRLTRILGIMYKSGVPLLESLELAKDTMQDPKIAASLDRVKASVNEGNDLATAMKNAGMIPARVTSMVAVGERGGGVDEMLEKISAYYDIEIEHQFQVLLVAAYFVAYLMMAVTVAMVVINLYQTSYLDPINELIDS